MWQSQRNNTALNRYLHATDTACNRNEPHCQGIQHPQASRTSGSKSHALDADRRCGGESNPQRLCSVAPATPACANRRVKPRIMDIITQPAPPRDPTNQKTKNQHCRCVFDGLTREATQCKRKDWELSGLPRKAPRDVAAGSQDHAQHTGASPFARHEIQEQWRRGLHTLAVKLSSLNVRKQHHGGDSSMLLARHKLTPDRA